MTEQEIESIADKVVSKMGSTKKNFFVQPEKHYQDHEWLGTLKAGVNHSIKIVGTAVVLGVAGGIWWLITWGKGIK